MANSRTLPMKIPIRTSKDTACMPTAPPPDLFVLLSLSLLLKTSACTEILRWALGQESPIFSDGQHLNKPLSFSPAPILRVWLLLRQAARPGFSYTRRGKRERKEEYRKWTESGNKCIKSFRCYKEKRNSLSSRITLDNTINGRRLIPPHWNFFFKCLIKCCFS